MGYGSVKNHILSILGSIWEIKYLGTFNQRFLSGVRLFILQLVLPENKFLSKIKYCPLIRYFLK